MDDKLSILFVGDFCSTNPDKITIGPEIQNVIDRTHYRFLNFEGPLQVGEKITPTPSFLKQSVKSPRWIMSNGFNLIGLANNHSYDFGENGLISTKEAFDETVKTIVCGNWNDVYNFTRIERSDISVGIILATSSDLSSLKNKIFDGGKYGCAYVNHPETKLAIMRAKQQCKYVVLVVHAGLEFIDLPLPEWRDTYRGFIDIGVDAVIGMHSHVPQGFEIYNEAPIFYSLGNFIFDKGFPTHKPYWNNGLVVEMTFKPNSIDFKTHNTSFSDLGLIELDKSSSSKDRIIKLCEILKDDEKYKTAINQEVLQQYPIYENWLLSGLNSFKRSSSIYENFKSFLKSILKRGKLNERISLHQIREDSTRWLLSRAYQLKSNTNL